MQSDSITNPLESDPVAQRSYEAWCLRVDVKRLGELLDACENPVELQDLAGELGEVAEHLQMIQARVQAHITRLYFPRALVEVA